MCHDHATAGLLPPLAGDAPAKGFCRHVTKRDADTNDLVLVVQYLFEFE